MNKKQHKAFKAFMVQNSLWDKRLTAGDAAVYYSHYKEGFFYAIIFLISNALLLLTKPLAFPSKVKF